MRLLSMATVSNVIESRGLVAKHLEFLGSYQVSRFKAFAAAVSGFQRIKSGTTAR
jgi:hypothetical protein